MVRWRIRELFSGATLVIALGVAGGCGLVSEQESGDSESEVGDGGTTAIGGSGGGAGTGGGRPCLYAGQRYQDGAKFLPDGCNACTCSDGSVSCTTIPCPTVEQCQSLTETFRWALDMAKTCDPDAESQCQVVATSAVQCGCPTYANDPNWVETLEGLVSGWKGVGCDGGLTCGMCPTPPIAGYCSSDGRCVDS